MEKTSLLSAQIKTIIESQDETNFLIEKLTFFIRVLKEVETQLIFLENSIGASAKQIELLKKKDKTIAASYETLYNGENIPVVAVQESVDYLDKHLLLEAVDLFEKTPQDCK